VTVNYTTATGSDPGRVTSSETTLSGSSTKSGSTVTVNLSSIIVSGSAVTGLDYRNFKIFVGTTAGSYSTFVPVSTTVTSTSGGKIDMVFILDRTGSMGGTIDGCKDSINAFASSLESAGADVKFGVVAYGDNLAEQMDIALPATAAQVQTFLATVSASGGADIPENPLDSILYAYNGYAWRSGAQKVFIVLTDAGAHQLGDPWTNNNCTTTLSTVVATLEGNATIYAISPKLSSGSAPDGYTKTADVRWMVDGYGWFPGVTTTTYGTTKGSSESGTIYSGTGGKWIEMPASGNVDLTSLGISTTVTKGYTLSFSYTFTGTTLYIHVLVDRDGDGVFESDGLITLSVSTSHLPSGELADPSKALKPASVKIQ